MPLTLAVACANVMVDVFIYMAMARRDFFVQPYQFDPEQDPEGEVPEEIQTLQLQQDVSEVFLNNVSLFVCVVTVSTKQLMANSETCVCLQHSLQTLGNCSHTHNLTGSVAGMLSLRNEMQPLSLLFFCSWDRISALMLIFTTNNRAICMSNSKRRHCKTLIFHCWTHQTSPWG